MLTKKNLWFLTLFSIILVMSIYYISYPNVESSLVNAEVNSNETEVAVNVSESETITALKVSHDESLENEINKLGDILNDETKTSEEKSDAYEALKNINTNKGKEESLEKTIKETFNYSCYAEIDGNNIKVVLATKEHSYELANKIIETVSNNFTNKTYVTVSFSA